MTRTSQRRPGPGGGASGQGECLKQLQLLQTLRQADLERLRAMRLRCDLLAMELAERNAEQGGRMTTAELASGKARHVDPFLLMPGSLRALERQEPPMSASLLSRILSSLLLRYARRAARARNYARAEVLYQAILELTPRPFIWRQLGDMLAGQGLFDAAVGCFDRVLASNDADAGAWHARHRALAQLSRHNEAEVSLERALALDPRLADRANG